MAVNIIKRNLKGLERLIDEDKLLMDNGFYLKRKAFHVSLRNYLEMLRDFGHSNELYVECHDKADEWKKVAEEQDFLVDVVNAEINTFHYMLVELMFEF